MFAETVQTITTVNNKDHPYLVENIICISKKGAGCGNSLINLREKMEKMSM